MIYDEAFFDAPLDRTRGDSIKWTQYGADVIPLWIADMDFRACEEITQALVRRAQEGCYGYARDSEAAIEAMIAYHCEHYHWDIEREWVVPQPGVVTSLNLFCKLLHETRPERSDVLIGEPVYHHFMSAAELQHIRERRIQLAFQGEPLAGFDPAQAAGAGGWLFCNPENPLGHLWSPEELRAVLAVAKQHDLLVASDEIHGGLVLDAPYTYTPMMALAEDDAERSRMMAFVAPSKTFNIPGLGCAFAIIPDPQLRAHFTRDYDQIVPAVNLFGWVGAEAAYRYGEPWRLGMLAYLRKNRALLEAAAAQWHLPLCRLDATYLAFLDGSTLLPCLKPGETLKAHFLRYGVAIHEGVLFGAPGWIRLNIATQHATLRQALERMDEAIGALRA